MGNQQSQASNCEFIEHSLNLLGNQQQVTNERSTTPVQTERQEQRNRGIHSKFVEHSQNSLKWPTATQKEGGHELIEDIHVLKRRTHSKFIESSQHLLGTLNVGRSWV